MDLMPCALSPATFPRLTPLIEQFLEQYQSVGLGHGFSQEDLEKRLFTLLERADWHLDHPHPFTPLHEAMVSPIDYQEMGLSFFQPLVDWSRSRCQGPWEEVDQARRAGHNAILLANHQTEADPQLMHLLLRPDFEALASAMRFMAGERVQKDPIAHPFSLGRHLVCVYSRKHVDHPPERRAEKLNHNATAMRQLKELLARGGVVLYLAPSGGRDRPDAQGNLAPAPFDPDAIEMMRLMAQSCGVPTACYPLALSTWSILPPPQDAYLPLGEVRRTEGGPIAMALGEAIQWKDLPQGREGRQPRAHWIHQQVATGYQELQRQLNLPTLR